MKKIKLILSIILGYTISTFLINNVFIANTPKINPFIARSLFDNLNNFINEGEKKDILNNKNDKRKEDFYPITKGIYAKEAKREKTILIRDKEVNWKIYQYEVNGKKISIKIPEGEELPSKEMVEKIFSR